MPELPREPSALGGRVIPVTLRPMPVWPYPETRDRRGRLTFKVTLRQSIIELGDELRHLGASNVILGTGLTEADVRLTDGWPRTDARAPRFPGVELSFDTRKYGRLVYATDVCVWWEHNVRSIALGLEALRAVDRYGITRRGEQYAGWRELPSGIVVGSGIATAGDAWGILLKAVGLDPDGETPMPLSDLYRKAAKATHPDHGGDGERFAQVQAAYEFLKVRG
jgi:hypothetical protein